MNATSIRVETKEFTSELEWCARFVERKTTIPVLSNVLFQRRGDVLDLSATDLEIGGSTSITVEGDGPDFEIIAPVSHLIKYLKKVDEPAVTLVPTIEWSPLYEGPHPAECEGGCSCSLKREVTRATLRLEHGDASMNLDGAGAASFPELPARSLKCSELSGIETAIPRALLAMTKEQSRFTLNGALLVANRSEARLVATDGHRLSCAAIQSHGRQDVKALIPRKALNELAHLGDSALFSANDDFAFFSVGARTITARKLSGNFPDYERVLPKDLSYATDVAVAPLRKVLDRVAIFADDRSRAILLSVNGALTVASYSTDRGAAEGKVAIDCVRRLDASNEYDVLTAGLAVPYASGFNADYLSDFLKTAGVPEVRFLFNSASKAVEWNAPGWRYVVMPMRDSDHASDPCAVGDCEPVPAVVEALDARAAETAPAVEPVVAVEPEPIVAEPVVEKRRRGRPRKVVEPAVVAEPAVAEPVVVEKRRPGRPRKNVEPVVVEPDPVVETPARVVPIRAPETVVAPVSSERQSQFAELRERARELRRQNLSVTVIAKELNAPQSSVWRWTRGA
jgi:DNA polymerase-3 subunit beta